MYKFQYDFWDEERFPNYANSVRNTYVNSLGYYYNYGFDKKNWKSDVNALDKMFAYSEYYFASLIKLRYAKKSNYNNILDRLKSIKLIKLLDPKLRSKFNGLTHNQVITMNPDPGCNDGFDKDSTLDIAMYHELGHIITSANNDDLDILKEILLDEYPELLEGHEEDLSNGFNLLDEVVVENAAEAVFYDRKQKQRKEVGLYTNPVIYLNGIFKSNFLEYREFQELAYRFALCLDFVPNDDSMNNVLDSLTRVMFSKNYVGLLAKELLDSNKGEDLIMMLICMGKIKEAKYSSFGYGDMEKLDASSSYLMFDELSDRFISSHEENKKVQS